MNGFRDAFASRPTHVDTIQCPPTVHLPREDEDDGDTGDGGAGLAAEMHSTPAHLEELDRNPLCNLSKEEKVLTKISDKDLSCTILATTPLRSLLHRAHAHSSSPDSAPSSIFLTLFQKCPWTPVG